MIEKHVKKRSGKAKQWFYPVLAVLFVLSFAFNVFGTGYINGWFGDFEEYSEKFVLSSVACAKEGNYNGNLIIPEEYVSAQRAGQVLDGDNGCTVYVSQFGLQGYTAAGVTQLFSSVPEKAVLFALKMLQIFAMIAVILLFIAFVQKRYGYIVAIILSILLLLSDWLIGYSRNLYWVPFLMFLPFIFSLYFYPKFKNKGKIKFYLILSGLFVIKFLTGYEFFSVIALSACVPVVYFELKNRASLKTIGIESAKIIAVAAVSFLVVMGIHLISMIPHYGSLQDSITAVKERGEIRSDPSASFKSTIANFEKTRPELYAEVAKITPIDALRDGKGSSYAYSLVMVINYLTLPVLTIPVQFKGLVQIILGAFITWVLLAFLSLYYIKKYLRDEHRPLMGVIVISLLAVVSWLIVAPGHFFEHAHLNAIIFYLPLMLWIYTVCAIALRVSFTRFIKTL